MREIYIRSNVGLLDIGRRGENIVTRVHLPEVPESGQAVTVFVLRNGDTAAYPASEIEITDTEIIWTVTSVDTGKSGRGKVQYRFSDSVTGEIIKTEIYHFVVGLAIDTEVGPAPDPYETWLDSLTDLAGQVQIDATQAQASAESASESAQNAEQSASSAGESAESAGASATSAAESAEGASQSEQTARGYLDTMTGQVVPLIQSIAQDAINARDGAVAAETATQAASARAVTAQSEAEASARQASASATTAATKEAEASASATMAATKASEASASATTANAKAAEAALSATQAINSAASAADSEQGAVAKAAEASASATAAQEARTGAESAAQTAQAGADAVGLLREQIYNSYPNVEAEEGSIVSITDGADGIPVKSLVVGIEPVQAGSGDPSPDNVRPITGWTGVNVQRTGKNLKNLEFSQVNSSNIITNVFSLKAGTYTLSVNYSGTPTWGVYLRNGRTANSPVIKQAYNATALTFTLDKNYSELCVSMYYANGITVSEVTNIQLEIGSTATAYEPYQGETYDITFPSEAGTVYGGSLDVTNGVLTVDKAINVIDGTQALSSNGIQPYGGIQVRYTPSPAKKLADASATQNSGLLSDKFDTSSPYTDAEYQLSGRAINANVYINMPASITTAAQARAWFAENNTQVVYELATPITYQLTPQEVITTMHGSNSIWADTGDVQEMAYRADTKLYIDGVFEDYQNDLTDYASALAALG